MKDFFKTLLDKLFVIYEGQYPTILTKLEQLMSKADEVLSDLGVVKANLAETQGDLAEVLALNTKQSGQIADLGASVDALKVELAGKVEDLSKLDAIAAQVAEIKATSREIADVVPEPSTEQPPTEEQPPAPPVDTPPPTE